MFEASLIPARDGSVAMGSRASGFRVRIALLAAVLALAAVGLGMAPASAHATTTCTAFNGAWNEQWYNPCSNPVNYWNRAQGQIKTPYSYPTVCLGLYDNGAQNCQLDFVDWGLSGNLHHGVALWQYDTAPGDSVWSGQSSTEGLWQWWCSGYC